MTLNTSLSPVPPEASRRQEWLWKIGLVLETPELLAEIEAAIAEAGAAKVFQFAASTPSFEVANAVDRERPDLLFVEFARTSKPAAEWLTDVRSGEDTPIVIAVHPNAEPAEMISALRAGATEFLSLPVRPAIYEAMDRIGALLESRRTALIETGKVAGVLSAKGGCGATSLACYLSAALVHVVPSTRVLVADLDYQSPGARSVFRATPRTHAGEAFEAVRRLSSTVWRDFVTPVSNGVDLLASPADVISTTPAEPPEPWRIESLFRFLVRQYNWVLVDLGRHLNPANWSMLQNIEELFIVTAPDVLALYQTRAVLQTLCSRGFEKDRIKIILNRNLSSPQDFWVESIEQMFEMTVFGVLPNDENTVEKLQRDRFEFPRDTPFGRGLIRIASRLAKPGAPGPAKKAA
jgi:pilus assembly protein CpaE